MGPLGSLDRRRRRETRQALQQTTVKDCCRQLLELEAVLAWMDTEQVTEQMRTPLQRHTETEAPEAPGGRRLRYFARSGILAQSVGRWMAPKGEEKVELVPRPVLVGMPCRPIQYLMQTTATGSIRSPSPCLHRVMAQLQRTQSVELGAQAALVALVDRQHTHGFSMLCHWARLPRMAWRYQQQRAKAAMVVTGAMEERETTQMQTTAKMDRPGAREQTDRTELLSLG